MATQVNEITESTEVVHPVPFIHYPFTSGYDVTRRGLPCTAAFTCTDYKVQGRTLEKVALELRGRGTMKVEGEVVPQPCDPYSLYVQLSWCTSLDRIILLSKAPKRDIVGNRVPVNMVAA